MPRYALYKIFRSNLCLSLLIFKRNNSNNNSNTAKFCYSKKVDNSNLKYRKIAKLYKLKICLLKQNSRHNKNHTEQSLTDRRPRVSSIMSAVFEQV